MRLDAAEGDMLVTRVRRYLDRTGMPPTVFGRRSIGDPRLVGDLLNGRQPRPRTIARIDAFIAAETGDAQ